MQRRRAVAVLAAIGLAAAVTIVACNGDDAAPSAGAPPSVSPEPPAALSPAIPAPTETGCGAAEQPSPGDSDRILQSGGLDRTYILHVPPAYNGATRVPLVLNLHGFGSSGAQQARYSRFPALADSEGFIVVSPDGAGTPQQWNIRRRATLPDDVVFIRELLEALNRELCIDQGRIFAAGISNGAAFSQQLACAMPGRFAAIAAVAALVYPLACTADAPVALIAFHGTGDVCVPYDGGPVTCGAARGSVPSVEDSAQNWARHNACNPVASRAGLTDHVRTIAYSECKDETAVVVFVIQDGGHTWPGSVPVARLGETTREIDATEQIWQFFRGQASLRAPATP